MDMGRTLEGLLVVSLEQAVAAPYCSLLLADAGARVIKVERPEGDFARGYDMGAKGQSAIFAWLNRGKQSLCLDLRQDCDLASLIGVLEQADVFLSNLAPGATTRLGIDPQAIRQSNPGLISCALSGYGQTGDAATRKAYDFLIQAEAGLADVTGTPDNPARVGVSITDLSTGLTAYSAILRALIERGKTGTGSDVDLTMFDVLADWMNMPLLAHRYGPGAPQRSGLQHSFIAPYGAFTCQGGDQVLLSIQNDREFSVFCDQVLNQPTMAQDRKFATNPKRFENRLELDALINATFAPQPLDVVIGKLNAARIANARLNSVADLSDHPFLTNATAQIGGAHIEMAALPLRTAQLGPTEVPDLGQHTSAIKSEFAPRKQPT